MARFFALSTSLGGFRQGYPLSPLLDVLHVVSEVLSAQICNCKDIEGFLLPGAGGLLFKISQYAHDATFILESEKSISYSRCCP